MFINKIKIQNNKGLENWSHSFDGLCSNKINLFVGPNGFGKSSLTAAFNAASHGKIKISKNEFYQMDDSRNPCLEIEYTSTEGTYTVIANNETGNVSREFSIFTINSPVFAKSTGRNMGGYTSRSAELYIRDVEVCKIPNKCELSYRFTEMKRQFGKGTPNLSDFFSSIDALEQIINSESDYKKCVSRTQIQKLLNRVSSENAYASIQDLRNFPVISSLLDKLMLKFSLTDEDAVRYIIQIFSLVKTAGFVQIQDAFAWLLFKKRKTIIDRRLSEFNTTGLSLHTQQRKNKLVISFGRADRMSNGERDVLSFVSSLVVFESILSKKPGILIMDEVFDYLDGCNLLAAQYYLSNMIKRIKSENKIAIPIIMTHLDPAVFANYCFKGMAVHYLTNKSIIDLKDKIVRLLILRGDLKETNDSNAENLEKYLLHYHPTKWEIPDAIKAKLPTDFWQDSESLREYLYSEVVDKYLHGQDYNALAVIIGLRIKVEERTWSLLPENKKEDYYSQFGSQKKLTFADDCGCDLPEVFYLLQPLYNDSLHLRSRAPERETRNKIESAYLKISSKVINTMIREIFS